MSSSTDPTHSDRQPVIVGMDGSPGAVHALAWAEAKSEEFGPVTPVHVIESPSRADLADRFASEPDRLAIRRIAQARLADAIGDINPALLDRARILEGHPGAELCRIAAEASLLVVGATGQSAEAEGLLGSVSAHCVKQAAVPVAVIPDRVPTDRSLRTVVVGVDGSDHGDRALRWAIDHVADGWRVHAVGALPGWNHMEGDFEPPLEVLEKTIRDRVEESVARVTGYPYDGPSIEIHAAATDARTALRDLAGTRADLLVVGARGHNAVPSLVLGSVSSALSHHPRVPTVVVH